MPKFTDYFSGLPDSSLVDAGKVSISDTGDKLTAGNIDDAVDELALTLSTAVQPDDLAAYAPLESPSFTGTVFVPDATADGEPIAYDQNNVSLRGLTITGNGYLDITHPGSEFPGTTASTGVHIHDTDVTNSIALEQNGNEASLRSRVGIDGALVDKFITMDVSTGAVSLAGASSVQIPDADADGEPIAFDQNDVSLRGLTITGSNNLRVAHVGTEFPGVAAGTGVQIWDTDEDDYLALEHNGDAGFYTLRSRVESTDALSYEYIQMDAATGDVTVPATNFNIPDGTANGEAIAFDQSGAELRNLKITGSSNLRVEHVGTAFPGVTTGVAVEVFDTDALNFHTFEQNGVDASIRARLQSDKSLVYKFVTFESDTGLTDLTASTRVTVPTPDTDAGAATKLYVDELVAGISPTVPGALSLTGTLAGIPAASVENTGVLYFATDVDGGTLYRSNGSSWVIVAPGVLISDQPIYLTASDFIANEGSPTLDMGGSATANKWPKWNMPSASNTSVSATFSLPAHWGSYNAIYIWASSTTSTTNTGPLWKYGHLGITAGTALEANTAAASVRGVAPGVADQVVRTTAASVTVTPGASDIVRATIKREGATDGYTASPCHLLGVEIVRTS